MCEAELWEEALIELKRQNYSPILKKEETDWLAKIYLGQERHDDVLKLQQRANTEGCDITSYLAVAYAHLGRHEQALMLAQEALEKRRPGAKQTLGHVYLAAGDGERALYWYEQAARGWFNYANGMVLVGKALAALEEYREAAIAYERALLWANFRRNEDLLQLAECYRKTRRARLADEIEQLAAES